jgi:hypothetical protein
VLASATRRASFAAASQLQAERLRPPWFVATSGATAAARLGPADIWRAPRCDNAVPSARFGSREAMRVRCAMGPATFDESYREGDFWGIDWTPRWPLAAGLHCGGSAAQIASVGSVERLRVRVSADGETWLYGCFPAGAFAPRWTVAIATQRPLWCAPRPAGAQPGRRTIPLPRGAEELAIALIAAAWLLAQRVRRGIAGALVLAGTSLACSAVLIRASIGQGAAAPSIAAAWTASPALVEADGEPCRSHSDCAGGTCRFARPGCGDDVLGACAAHGAPLCDSPQQHCTCAGQALFGCAAPSTRWSALGGCSDAAPTPRWDR